MITHQKIVDKRVTQGFLSGTPLDHSSLSSGMKERFKDYHGPFSDHAGVHDGVYDQAHDHLTETEFQILKTKH